MNFSDWSEFYRHGENWQNFRSKVQQVLLQPRVAKQYIKPIEETAMAFLERYTMTYTTLTAYVSA